MPLSKFVIGLASVLALHAQQSSAAFACSYLVGKPVNTTSGLIHGHSAPNATGVSEYLGIPFAQPPVGSLRFAPPEPYVSNKTFNGTRYSPICSQAITPVPVALDIGLPNVYNLLSNLAGTNQTPSEDCLYLNVWTKPQTQSLGLKPVMVWIYGGGFTLGGTNTSGYSGQYFADEQDVVFVNFNYRLGIFGFSGSPAGVQNVALLDQRLALEWVRSNIHRFGGDPSRITLFGESAGAASVDYYSYAWTEDPIVAGVILESGSATGFDENKNLQTASQAWYNATTTLGCGNASYTDTAANARILKCMQGANITAPMITNATNPGAGFSSILGNYGPVVDNKTVFPDYEARAKAGKIIKAPAIIGNNDYEAGLFILILAGAGMTNTNAFWDQFTQLIFTCPSRTAAYYRSINDIPVWRYRYFGMTNFNNLQLPTSVNRSYHTSEIYPLFGTDQDITGFDSTWQERNIGRYMANTWSAFAHCPKSGVSQQYGWPMFTPNGTDSLIAIGRNNGSLPFAEFLPASDYDDAPKTCPPLTLS